MTSEYDRPLLESMESSSTEASSLSLEDKHFDITNAKDKKTLTSIHNATMGLLEQESGQLRSTAPHGKSQISETTVESDDSNSNENKVDIYYYPLNSHDNQHTGSGADSDVEDNVEAPLLPKEYDPTIDDRLPDTVTLLTTPDGGKLYLIGTAHFSEKSHEDVSNIIQAVQPDIVMIELCKARVHLLQLDEKTILREAENLSIRTVRETMQQNGLTNGLLYLLLLNMSVHLTRELGMAPGGEFRRAFNEAKKVQNCLLHLGDRPINITLQRALRSLGWWQTLRLAWHLLTSKETITLEEVERLKSRDMLEAMLAEMTGEFPALGEVFVRERDIYLTHSLQLACLPHRTATGWKPSRVVGVVGIGHTPGIIEHWGKVQPSEIVPIMRIPPRTLSSKIIRITIKASLVGAVIYVGYKIIPLPSGLTLQSIKSSVEGLLKVSVTR